MLKGFTRSSTSPQLCSLYFKGLVGDDSLAGFGVAICGHRDDILFQLNGPIHGSEITVLEAELMALKRGLMEAAGLGIDHISIYCDYYPVYVLVKILEGRVLRCPHYGCKSNLTLGSCAHLLTPKL
ncbi:putative ribonuclease H domain-containing protein [Arabidopsis thaliana]